MAADDASAARPCGAEISTRPLLRVRMIRQPPRYVPMAIASAHASFTQKGIGAFESMVPCATSARKMMPIVFCASLVPCASETSEAEPIWPQRNPFSRDFSGTLLVIR